MYFLLSKTLTILDVEHADGSLSNMHEGVIPPGPFFFAFHETNVSSSSVDGENV